MKLRKFDLRRYEKLSEAQRVCIRMGTVGLLNALAYEDFVRMAGETANVAKRMLSVGSLINRKRYRT